MYQRMMDREPKECPSEFSKEQIKVYFQQKREHIIKENNARLATVNIEEKLMLSAAGDTIKHAAEKTRPSKFKTNRSHSYKLWEQRFVRNITRTIRHIDQWELRMFNHKPKKYKAYSKLK